MADDLTIVASLLRDTNKKLDKLHSDNEQNDTPADIIKDSLPEILNDIYQSNRQIDQWKKEADRDKKTDNIIREEDEKAAKREETTQKILGDIKEPLKTLGLAIPKITKPSFDLFRIDFAKKELPPSDFKLMVQALSPKALTQGFKVGLGDMFKELGGGIKKIGSGMKSLATKGLTAAQRKSEEKEKNSKENKKDSFLKKLFGSTIKLLGGILKTVTLAAKAGFIALAGAGALYALAKLIESPSWKTVAGIIEYVLNTLADIFTWANDLVGPLGVLGTALALWYGTGGILTLAGMAVKALGGMFLGKLGLTAATEAATTALGATGPKGLGLLGKLGLLGLALAAAGAAIYVLGDELEKFRKKAADKRAIKREDETTKALKKGDPAELERLRLAMETEILEAGLAREGTAAAKSRAAAEANLKRIKAEQAAALRKTQSARDAAVFGGTPKQISENLAKLFKDAFNSTTFEGNAEQRVGQVKGLIGGISKRLLTSKSFQDLSGIDKQGFIKKLQSAESGAFNLVRGRGLISRQVLFGRGDQAGGARIGLDEVEQKKLMFALANQQKELRLLRKSQIEKLQEEAKEFLKLQEEAKETNRLLQLIYNDPLGETNDVPSLTYSSVVGGATSNISYPVSVPMWIMLPNGQTSQYRGEGY